MQSTACQSGNTNARVVTPMSSDVTISLFANAIFVTVIHSTRLVMLFTGAGNITE